MTSIRKAASAAALASALVLGGCAYDGYGSAGVNVGYGNGYYYDNDPYGYSPFGWYDGYYYPGSGYWLYDRGGNRHRWSDGHRRHWEQRREHSGKWNGPATQPWRRDMRNDGNWQGRDRGADGARQWRGRQGSATPQQQAQPQVQRSPDRGQMTAPDRAARREAYPDRERRGGRDR